MMENLKIEIARSKPGSGVVMRVSGEEVFKTKAYSPEYLQTYNARIDFIKFQTGDNVSIIIDNKEISLPKQVLIEALEFLTEKKRIDVN